MYAIIATGGKQYKVLEGSRIAVEKIDRDVGSRIVLEQVLCVGGNGELKVGKPYLAGVTVDAEIAEQGKEKKILVLKKKRRKGYRKQQGHRQMFTVLKIGKIAVAN